MKIVVFGASGKIGRLVVRNLLVDGHEVLAVVHTHNPFSNHKNLKVIKFDVTGGDRVDPILKGKNVIISCLGSWGTESNKVLTLAMDKIIPSMKRLHIFRIISLTGSDALVDGEIQKPIEKISHFIFSILASKVLSDGEDHIKQLAHSSLDWTVIRSPRMNNLDENKYLLDKKRPMPWNSVSRKSVAQSICDQIKKGTHVKQSPFIHSR